MRLASENDIDAILSIYDDARKFMIRTGNKNQWINGYPSIKNVIEDLKQKNLYVIEANRINGTKKIAGVVTLTMDEEKNYKKIYAGTWLSNSKYGTIHRLAVSEDYRKIGIAKQLLDNVCAILREHEIHFLRADTHRDNIPMQKFLEKNGFIHCGIIYLDGTEERLAYEYELRE